MDHVSHDNAFLGKIKGEKSRVSVISLGTPKPMNPRNNFEDVLSGGSANLLEINQRYRILYKCTYDLLKFPFDKPECNITIKILMQKHSSISFVQDEPAIVYRGPTIIS